MATYRQRLTQLTAARGNLCVGIDPHPGVLKAWDLPLTASGLERCARGVVEALGESVAVFKPQSAFFESYGSAGVAVLEAVLADIRAAGALSIVDAKRGDIGSTMAAYAEATSAGGGARGAIVVDDEMVDEAGVKLAHAILARGTASTPLNEGGHP